MTLHNHPRRCEPKFWWALAFIFAFFPVVANAWGAQGHEIVAAIAEPRMSPAARQLVRELVGDEPLSDPAIATWADAQRDPRTRPWHYVNIPFSTGRYDSDRDCARGCAVSTIEHAAEVLAGFGPSLGRVDALRWLVHVVADLHQPLHAGDGWDRGGNACAVRFGRHHQPTNLHRVWDSEVMAPLMRHRRPLEVARLLDQAISPGQAATWAATFSPSAWAEESNREARAIYDELGRRPGDNSILALPTDYSSREQSRVRSALQRAGVRLATLLDRIARSRAVSRGGGFSIPEQGRGYLEVDL